MAKQLPDFKSEDEERRFWQEHDSTEYLDWDQAERAAFPNLKPSTIPAETRAERVTFDDHQMHIHLMDGRTISVPFAWIPSLANAVRADLEKVCIGWDGLLIYWDPDDGPINEDLLVATYLRGGKDQP